MTSARALVALSFSCVLACSSIARADDAEARDERSVIARGRALTWGFSAIVPILLGDVRETSGRTLAYLNPGGGVEGRVGYELEHGITIGLVGGVNAFVSENSRALAMYRGGVQGRWTIDVGSIVAPVIGLAAGVFLAQLDAGMVATAYGRVLLAAQLVLAPWIAVEAGVSVEGALGMDAFADPIAWISPQVGLSFAE
ncbi:MAG: hypothetical protein M3Y87_11290 [Myxococcota bacterium]|nr:hypothetical protein [Myxococcota bacterium]